MGGYPNSGDSISQCVHSLSKYLLSLSPASCRLQGTAVSRAAVSFRRDSKQQDGGGHEERRTRVPEVRPCCCPQVAGSLSCPGTVSRDLQGDREQAMQACRVTALQTKGSPAHKAEDTHFQSRRVLRPCSTSSSRLVQSTCSRLSPARAASPETTPLLMLWSHHCLARTLLFCLGTLPYLTWLSWKLPGLLQVSELENPPSRMCPAPTALPPSANPRDARGVHKRKQHTQLQSSLAECEEAEDEALHLSSILTQPQLERPCSTERWLLRGTTRQPSHLTAAFSRVGLLAKEHPTTEMSLQPSAFNSN